MNAKLVMNTEHNGLELYFPEKPTESALTQLGSNKRWHYHRKKKCWYARNTDENLAFANQFLSGELSKASADEAGAFFFPLFDSVGGTPIYRSSDLSCWKNDEGYFQDICAYVEVRPQRITIRDLTHALVPGRECERLVLEPTDPYQAECLHAGLNTFHEVYEKFFVRREFPDCQVYTSKRKASRVFTPFKRINPIRIPAKWTLPHIWKAILAGQIYLGECDGHYSDDYAYDAAVGYHEGIELHLPSFAKKLIEEPSGWYVHPRKSEGESIPLSVNCHSFDLNTLWFEADCTWEEVDRRRKARAQEKTNHNAALEMQLLSYDEVFEKTEDSKLYDVRHIEMNHNTGRYEIRERMMLRHELYYAGRLNRDVIGIEVHPISSGDLFEVECHADLALSDERIIPTDRRPVVTGLALQELLGDSDIATGLHEVQPRRQTRAEFRNDLERWRDGQIQRLLNPIPRSRFEEALTRLDQEEVRIHE